MPGAHPEASLSAPQVSVIVPALDAAATISRALAAIADQAFDAPYEVIVVDDGSSDGTAELAEAAARDDLDLQVVRRDHGGPAAARNAGVAASRSSVLAFTDSDCYPTRGWLAAGLRALESADLVQGAVAPEPGVDRGPWDRTLWVERETGLFETANLFVRRAVFERIGGFEVWLEPEIGKPLGEDMWLGWRARRSGARSAFCPEALVHHAIFTRGAAGFLAERRRLRYFPAMAAQMPELRDQFFFARWFLARRSAAFDAALAGTALAVARRTPWPVAAALPYGRMLFRESRPYRKRAPLVAAVRVVGDAITLASLVRGSLRSRAPVL